MPFKIITVPFDREKACFLEEELNKFCLNKTILSYKAEFFQNCTGAYWSVFIEYEQVLEASDPGNYQLNAPQQLLLTRLKEWRKQKAEETGVPVYVICTNKQAIDLIKKAPKTIEAAKVGIENALTSEDWEGALSLLEEANGNGYLEEGWYSEKKIAAEKGKLVRGGGVLQPAQPQGGFDASLQRQRYKMQFQRQRLQSAQRS